MGREQVDAQVSGPDCVGLVHRLIAPHVEARESSRESERNQQAEEREHCSLKRADVWHARGTVARDGPSPEPAPEHDEHQYREKDAGGDDGADDREIDDLKHVFGRRLTGPAWLAPLPSRASSIFGVTIADFNPPSEASPCPLLSRAIVC